MSRNDKTCPGWDPGSRCLECPGNKSEEACDKHRSALISVKDIIQELDDVAEKSKAIPAARSLARRQFVSSGGDLGDREQSTN